MLLRDLHQRYIAERLNLRPNSARQLLYTINNFQRFLCREPELADLTKQNVLGFMRSFSNPRTANGNRTNLLTLWRFAEESDLLPPPPRISKRIEPAHIPQCWTLGEVRRLWAATDLLEGDWQGVPIRLAWKIAFAVLWDTAARIGTLWLAEISELNFLTGFWIAPAEHIKGRRSDKIYRLHSDTVSLIKESLAAPRKKLWPFPFNQDTAYRHWEKILELAGLPVNRKAKFHCLRRTAESYAAANMGIEKAAAAVGHSVQVAKKHYISPQVVEPPHLIDGLPRPF